jgi:hypothetical protein
MKRATNFVYIIHAVGISQVKIGFSDDPKLRLSDLQTGSPFPLELIGSREGTVKLSEGFMGISTKGLIQYARGRITSLDPEGLAVLSYECYRILG